MERFEITRACLRRTLAVGCLALAVSAVSTSAQAEPPPVPGGPALRQARGAWERGAIETSEPLYREAIEKGGLAPNEVLEGYVRLGVIRAALGKKDSAINAFRAASVLDATFVLPATDPGSKAPALAAQAKKDTAKIGAIRFSMQAPKEAPPGKPFKVTANVDAPHVGMVIKVGLYAKDGTSGKDTTAEAKGGESVDLEVPADIAMPNASIVVRLDALDARGNRIASAEERVRIPDSGSDVSATGATTGGPGAWKAETGGVRAGGTFWSSPWPYVIGGVALLGAGAAIFFGTRPPAEVNVGAPDVQTR